MTRKVLTIDIETAPAQVYVWSLFKPFISLDQIIHPVRVVSFAAKWTDSNRVYYHAEWDAGTDAMLEKARALLDAADVVVTFNGDRFDIPHLNREFALAKIPMPSPYTSVDLYKVVKKNHMWMSNKLAHVTEQLELSGKLDHHGFNLWREVLGDFGEERQVKARRLFRRYNKQDVVTTEELYFEVLPLITNLPSAALWNEAGDEGRPTCPNCASNHVTRQGYKRTKTRRYPQYQCQDCGRWFSDTRSDLGVGSA